MASPSRRHTGAAPDLQSELLRLMVDAAASVNRAGSVERALREVTVSVCELTPWEVCAILRLAPTGELQPLRSGEAGNESGEQVHALYRQIGDEHLRAALDGGEPVWLETPSEAPSPSGTELFHRAFLLPIRSDERDFGLLVLGSRRERTVGPREVETEALINIAALLGLLLERRTLELQVAHLTEEERRRIGHELHDVLGQELTGLAMLAGALGQDLEREGRPQAEQAQQMLEIVRSAQGNLRNLIRGLVPVLVDASGLMAALAELARETSEVHDIDCRFRSPTALDLDDNLVATHLYRIALEAVHNAVRHADAEHIVVTLEAVAGGLTLTVRDDGRGMPALRTEDDAGRGGGVHGGMGLRILRYRAGLLDAELAIDSAPGRGTTVTCEVPLPESADLGSRQSEGDL